MTGKSKGKTPNREGHSWGWWLLLGSAAVVAGTLATEAKFPGGWLIGALLVAVVAGLVRPEHPRIPVNALLGSQAVIGLVLAGSFRPESLPIIASHWLPVLLIVAATLGVSFLAGIVLARITPLGRETATMGTLPGGASGMIAMSMGSNADTRMVALMQYMRVVLVVLSAALLARFVLHPAVPVHAAPVHSAMPAHLWRVSGATAALAVLGGWAGLRLRIPAGALLGPMILGILAGGFDLLHPLWPSFIPKAAYVVVGLYIGLLFDRASLAQAGRLIPIMLANTLLLMGVCAATGKFLSMATGADYLTVYLATTPGGMDSIAVVALGSGADVSFMLAVQMVRVFATIFAGPLFARWVLSRK
ncbi:MAG TPA: AbrB family transcriptional regulator [Thermodesulfobacteriota bacterium]|nr:AbrB family transcriptional regulator [Thermodesulfobacteriota bacterium]